MNPSTDTAAIVWADPARQTAFEGWLAPLCASRGLVRPSLRLASADASFRRYFRMDDEQGQSFVIMDAPPDKENSQPFVAMAQRLAAADLRVPQVLDWTQDLGFLLLTDLGHHPMMAALDEAQPEPAVPLYRAAVLTLLQQQTHADATGLPVYDDALLRRELSLFPDWYLGQHKGFELTEAHQNTLNKTFDVIIDRVMAAPTVLVHRDFMARNLMLPGDAQAGEAAHRQMGVLDFQDAVQGPITYDIASLMRDAFISWDEDMVLEVTIRYWEAARKAGLMDFDGWSDDFGAFYRAVEWMGLQRHLKVAGIFARLTLRDGKPKYLADAPRFIHYIRSTALRYRELTPLLRLIDEVEGWQAASGFAYGRM